MSYKTPVYAAIGFLVIRIRPPSKAILLGFGLVVALSACAKAPEDGSINDPYESVNRLSHGVNKGADRVFFKPASQVYGTVVPEPVRSGLTNVASNLDEPRTMVNHLLQGDIESSVHTLARFMTNTVFGVFGLFDPAGDYMAIEKRETGFADTLAAWGVRDGAYLELPLFGPSSERDSVGLAVDIATNPLAWVSTDTAEIAAATSLPSVLNSRYEFGDTVDSILYDSADSYAQLRLFYTENRRFQLDGQSSAENAFDPYENLYEEVYEGLYDEF